ncbi:MAG: hypothetical protein HQL82_11525 [Magnetococcales bacterium]|nr:hypothetical protein [Magnetococcales bacterium]
MRKHSFAWTLAAAWILFMGMMAVNWLLLWRAGETDLATIAQRQVASQGMANLLSVPFFDYKRALYLIRKPEITALGSSRSLQIRQYFFTRPFYNMGGGSKELDDAFAMADELLLEHPPKLIVQALDIWTFWSDRPVLPSQAQRPRGLRVARGSPINPLLLPTSMLFNGTLTWPAAARILAGAPHQPLPTFGIHALVNGSGFADDGSSHYLGRLEEALLDGPDQRFRGTLEKLGQPGSQLLPASSPHVNHREIRLLRMFIDEMAAHHITVMPVLVPLPPLTYDRALAMPEHAYIDQARAVLAREIPELLDLLDGRRAGSNNCEFYDGTHGGEITYARIALKIAATRPDLAHFIAVERLQQVVERYAGFSTAPIDSVGLAFRDRFLAYHRMTRCRESLPGIRHLTQPAPPDSPPAPGSPSGSAGNSPAPPRVGRPPVRSR